MTTINRFALGFAILCITLSAAMIIRRKRREQATPPVPDHMIVWVYAPLLWSKKTNKPLEMRTNLKTDQIQWRHGDSEWTYKDLTPEMADLFDYPLKEQPK